MKRVLEDELISLAERILKLKNRADIHQLKKETGILYEKLSILAFAELHFGGLKSDISKTEFKEVFLSNLARSTKRLGITKPLMEWIIIQIPFRNPILRKLKIWFHKCPLSPSKLIYY